MNNRYSPLHQVKLTNLKKKEREKKETRDEKLGSQDIVSYKKKQA